MNLDEIYETKRSFIVASDLQRKKSVLLTIADVGVRTFSDGRKLVSSFKETEKQFSLNKTNARMLQNLTKSSETNDWLGRTITLSLNKTSLDGKEVDCVRIAPDLRREV